MPDLTVEYYYMCMDNENCITYINSESGNRYHCEYHNRKWECDCNGFKYRHTCKHIKQAEEKRCNWNQYLDGNEPIERGGKFYCPKCGGETKVFKVGV